MTYALGSNGGYTLKNENNYKAPAIVQHLIVSNSPYGNQSSSKEFADENPSATDYYDGSHKLNTLKVSCKIYSSQSDCLHQASCGWCGATGSCIMGTQMGPLETCSQSTYIFTTGAIHNPQEREIRENVGGLSFNIVQGPAASLRN